MFSGTENSMAAHRMLAHVSGSQKSKIATTQTGSTCILPSRRDRNVNSNKSKIFIFCVNFAKNSQQLKTNVRNSNLEFHF